MDFKNTTCPLDKPVKPAVFPWSILRPLLVGTRPGCSLSRMVSIYVRRRCDVWRNPSWLWNARLCQYADTPHWSPVWKELGISQRVDTLAHARDCVAIPNSYRIQPPAFDAEVEWVIFLWRELNRRRPFRFWRLDEVLRKPFISFNFFSSRCRGQPWYVF